MPRRLLPLLAALALGGCSAIAALDRAAATRDVHELRAPQGVTAAGAPLDLQLVVEVPDTGGAIASDRILVRPGPTQIAYLPDARWSASAPEMIQNAMVEMFLRADAFSFVGARPLGSVGNIALVTRLLDFGADVAPGDERATVGITLVAQLVRERDAEILARRSFSRSVGVPDTSSAAIVAGFAAVSDAVLADLGRWAIAAARRQ
jgi:cholesterol transport system auxiliary component